MRISTVSFFLIVLFRSSVASFQLSRSASISNVRLVVRHHLSSSSCSSQQQRRRRRRRIQQRSSSSSSSYLGVADVSIHDDDVAQQEEPMTNADDDDDDNDANHHHHAYPATPTFRECWEFVLPAVGIYVCPPLMSLIDAAFVGRTSSSIELAALGPASSISDGASLPLLWLSMASTNLIAKSYAKKDEESLSQISKTALGIGGMGGLAIAALLLTNVRRISSLYCGVSSSSVSSSGSAAAAAVAMAEACTQYVAIRALALPFVVITTIAQATLIGVKDTKTPMISVLLAGACNLLGDLILVKWLGKGIAGAAWATSASQVVAATLLLSVLQKRGFLRKKRNVDVKPSSSSSSSVKQESSGTDDDDDEEEETKTKNEPTTTTTTKTKTTTTTTTTYMETTKQLLAFVPFMYVMAVKIGLFNSCAAAAASLGGTSAAAYTALSSVSFLCMHFAEVGNSLAQAFLPPFQRTSTSTSLSQKTTTTTKKSSSSSSWFDLDAAMPTIRQLLKVTIGMSTFVTAVAAIMIGIFGGTLTNDVAVLAEMRRTLPVILATLAFHGSYVTLEGIVVAQKQFRALSLCYTVLAVAVAAYLPWAVTKLGLAGVCGTFLWFCATRIVAFSALGGLWWRRRPSSSSSSSSKQNETTVYDDDDDREKVYI